MTGIEDDVEYEANRRNLLLRAYVRFHEMAQAPHSSSPDLVPYTAADAVSAVHGDLIWGWGVPTEVKETINSLNSWAVHLRNWGIWNEVLSEHLSEEDRWEIETHFIEPVAFYCMLQPTSVSERMVIASETTLHHANRLAYPQEPDRLDQDKLKPGAILRKTDRRRQLRRLAARWRGSDEFLDALNELDGQDYRIKTKNFRDLSAHSFSPRLHIGHVPRAIRSYGPWEELVAQSDGTFIRTPHATKKAVSYAMADMPPLDLREMQQVNSEEYAKAKNAMTHLTGLIEELCSNLRKN